MNQINILAVEDDPVIVNHLTEFLKSEGFVVQAADGQEKAIKFLETNPCDLVLVDISLAQGNGYALCAAIKSEWNFPVIFLTASGDEYSVVTGLNMGADDYVSKPFRPRELAARIKNVLRRTGKTQSMLTVGSLKVDTGKAQVWKCEQELFLSALEYRLLLVFINHRGMLLSRSVLLDEIWDAAGEYVNDNTLTVYIKRLREKIEDDPQKPEIIKTVRGLGYKMD